MLSSVSYVCLDVCAGMWVISRGIYLGLLVLSFLSIGLAVLAFGSFLFVPNFLGCVCVLFLRLLFCKFSALLCGRNSEPRFPRDPVLYNPLQVLFRMLRWLEEHPAPPPRIFFPTTAEGVGDKNMA